MTKVFASLPLKDRKQLAQLVAEHCQALDESLKVVERSGEEEIWGSMDLLAIDGGSRPVIIDVALQDGDELLVEGLAHLGWMAQNRKLLAALMAEEEVNMDLSPKLILVAPDFSSTLQKAATGLTNLAIDLFRFRWLESGEEKGLFLESAFSSASRETPAGEALGSSGTLSKSIVPLEEEEIATFMNMNPRFTL